MFELHKVMKFMRMILRFQQIRRGVFVPGEERNENDVEHSYILTMLALYLALTYKLTLNLDLVIKYCLIHDLVEVYAGDSFAFDPAARATKKEREEQSLKRLREEFPELQDIFSLIDAYELRLDPESRFVYSLDKIVPTFINDIDGGRAWKVNGVTLQEVIDLKEEKVIDPAVMQLFRDHLVELRKREAELF